MTTATETPTSLVVERMFPHPQEKLWRALTESSLLAQWMMRNDFEPTVHHKFQFRADPAPNWNGIVDCEVLSIDPPHSLAYSWGTGPAEYGMQWNVQFTLTPADGGTQLRMEQSGFRSDQHQAYGGAKYGWQRFFGNLEKLLESASN